MYITLIKVVITIYLFILFAKAASSGEIFFFTEANKQDNVSDMEISSKLKSKLTHCS